MFAPLLDRKIDVFARVCSRLLQVPGTPALGGHGVIIVAATKDAATVTHFISSESGLERLPLDGGQRFYHDRHRYSDHHTEHGGHHFGFFPVTRTAGAFLAVSRPAWCSGVVSEPLLAILVGLVSLLECSLNGNTGFGRLIGVQQSARRQRGDVATEDPEPLPTVEAAVWHGLAALDIDHGGEAINSSIGMQRTTKSKLGSAGADAARHAAQPLDCICTTVATERRGTMLMDADAMQGTAVLHRSRHPAYIATESLVS
ncbi:hypothetical protein AK812_SmicGene11132 [Symbiodinium microadriaticum]|uniref:Uncharacterized protein n=1 Tax=Symbiodinium microadriaticum TaxID=2951 RepID=A0A1Q9EDX4_SYMMI|nr:hypothetical protein AK812_SmicGene11132 [Symbiodinium microadriaticum]